MVFTSTVWAEPVSILQEANPPIETSVKTVKKRMRLAVVPKNPARFGIASWYSESDPGINRHTANGEIFNDKLLTCASWDYAFGTYLEIKNLENGKKVICRVNDRGPSKRLDRIIDLTRTAFKKIASPRKGLIRVSVRVVPKSAV